MWMIELWEVLDVGSGKNPRGHVNIDIKFYKKTKNFVKANASYLPFRTNSFRYVISNQVIEHVDKPIKMLKEMVRVCIETVTFQCPHRLAGRNPAHKNYFSITWFHSLLEKLGLSHDIAYGAYSAPFFFRRFRFLFPFVHVPTGLTIIIYKRADVGLKGKLKC